MLRFFAILMLLWIAGCSASGGDGGSGAPDAGTSSDHVSNALFSVSGDEPEITADSPVQPHVIFIVIDTLRADHVSFYGYQRNTTPNIDAFARESYAFSNAIAPAPWTVPAFTSIMTGMHAFNHNKNYVNNMAEPISHSTIGAYMGDAGYSTVSIQTNVFLEDLDYEFQERRHYFDDSFFLDELAAQEALELIGDLSPDSKPLFLFMGMTSPHWPYRADTSYFEEFVFDDLYVSQPRSQAALETLDGVLSYDSISPALKERLGPPAGGERYYMDARLYQAAYDGEIKYSDSRVGRILDDLRQRGLYDGAMIIIMADHGENMVDHEPNFSHGSALYNSQIHVPLFIKMPGQTSGRVVTEYVRTIDVFPTIAEAIGREAVAVDGRSLRAAISALPEEQAYPIVSYLGPYFPNLDAALQHVATALIEGAQKIIRQTDQGVTSTYLYDLKEDPNEQVNLAFAKQYENLLDRETTEISVLIQGN